MNEYHLMEIEEINDNQDAMKIDEILETGSLMKGNF